MLAVLNAPTVGRRPAADVRPSRRSPRSVAMRLVADYLRDWGLRDPELVAAETRRLIEQAEAESEFADISLEALDGANDAICRRFYETAIRITVAQVEAWVTGLAAAPTLVDRADGHDRCAVVPRLPELLSEYPEAIMGRPAPREGAIVDLGRAVQAVVPPALHRRMRGAPPVRNVWVFRGETWSAPAQWAVSVVRTMTPRRVR